MSIFQKFWTKVFHIVFNRLRVKLGKGVHIAPAGCRQESVNKNILFPGSLSNMCPATKGLTQTSINASLGENSL